MGTPPETDIFTRRAAQPMLLQTSEPFYSPDFLYEIKFDGTRILAYADKSGADFINRRGKNVRGTYPELQEITAALKCGRAIFDGEIVVPGKGGAPDFAALQRRALVTDKTRIERLSRELPVNYVIYDILYLDGELVTGLPLSERKKLLPKAITESHRFALSRVFSDGLALHELTKKMGLEGIVAKRRESIYRLGKRSADWLKIKNQFDEDFPVIGYDEPGDGGRVLRIFFGTPSESGGGYEYYGSLTGLSELESQKLRKYADKNPAAPPVNEIPQDLINPVWVKPNITVTVRYMLKTESGRLRQPYIKELFFP